MKCLLLLLVYSVQGVYVKCILVNPLHLYSVTPLPASLIIMSDILLFLLLFQWLQSSTFSVPTRLPLPPCLPAVVPPGHHLLLPPGQLPLSTSDILAWPDLAMQYSAHQIRKARVPALFRDQPAFSLLGNYLLPSSLGRVISILAVLCVAHTIRAHCTSLPIQCTSSSSPHTIHILFPPPFITLYISSLSASYTLKLAPPPLPIPCISKSSLSAFQPLHHAHPPSPLNLTYSPHTVIPHTSSLYILNLAPLP